MSRGILFGAGLGIAVVGWLWVAGPAPPPAEPSPPGIRLPIRGAPPRASEGHGEPADLLRQVRALEERLAREVAERRQLAARLDALVARLADAEAAAPGSPEPEPGADAAGAPAAVVGASPAAPPPEDAAASSLERALITAGVDPVSAADIRQRQDELTLAEMYLRDQAIREGWLDTPRFQEALAGLEQQRVSLRDEIGDGAYDRYLAARGEPNRVRVDEVMSASPAAAAGLQRGDIVLRYGDARIFRPGDLVAETRAGSAGEPVRVEVLRAGQRIEIEVPRGPLGLRIAAAQGEPGDG